MGEEAPRSKQQRNFKSQTANSKKNSRPQNSRKRQKIHGKNMEKTSKHKVAPKAIVRTFTRLRRSFCGRWRTGDDQGPDGAAIGRYFWRANSCHSCDRGRRRG